MIIKKRGNIPEVYCPEFPAFGKAKSRAAKNNFFWKCLHQVWKQHASTAPTFTAITNH